MITLICRWKCDCRSSMRRRRAPTLIDHHASVLGSLWVDEDRCGSLGSRVCGGWMDGSSGVSSGVILGWQVDIACGYLGWAECCCSWLDLGSSFLRGDEKAAVHTDNAPAAARPTCTLCLWKNEPCLSYQNARQWRSTRQQFLHFIILSVNKTFL